MSSLLEVPSLKKHYMESVIPELKQLYAYKNPHQIPVVQKIVINSGISAHADKSWIEEVKGDVSRIVGQKPILTKAKKSISNFKLRAGMPIGVKVTLRGSRMYEFLHRLIAIALPNVRDFQGISKKFDGRGNYSLGIIDHSIFPEVNVEPGRSSLGFDVTIVTSASTDSEAFDLLRLLGMPFRR